MIDSFQAIDKHDSRHAEKQKDIAATIKRMGEIEASKRRDWESKLGDDLVAATEEVVLKGGVNCVGYTKAYATNFEQWLRSING